MLSESLKYISMSLHIVIDYIQTPSMFLAVSLLFTSNVFFSFLSERITATNNTYLITAYVFISVGECRAEA